MKAVTNPYPPNAGAEPQAVVGRDDQLESFDLLLARIEAGRTEQSMIVTGLRGVGKHRYAAFTVPQFDKFILRAMPELVVPELRRRKPKS